MITFSHLHFSYDEIPVLKGVSGSIAPGKLTFLLGENGSGKTTLLKCLLRLLPYQGEVLIDEKNIQDYTTRELARKIAYIPQNHTPRFNFLVKNVVLMGVSSSLGALAQPKKEHEVVVEEALERMNISHLSERGYAELSGGERQLVLIARALAQLPDILMMDEPTSSLDFGNQIRLLEHCLKLTKQGLSIAITSHQPQHALQFADETILLHRGEVIAQGPPRQIVTKESLFTLYGIDLMIHDLDGVPIPHYAGGAHVLE